MSTIELTETTATLPGRKPWDKTERYGWETIDSQGEYTLIDKKLLRVHPDYQRELQPGEVKEFSAHWSWIACGALSVAFRGGEYWVVDGQQRLNAALRRSDIRELPCIIFDTLTVSEEADAFMRVNTHRKTVSAVAKFKAGRAAGYEVQTFVSQLLESLGLRVASHPKTAHDLKAIGRVVTMASIDRDRCVRVLGLAAVLSSDSDKPVPSVILGALWTLDRQLVGGVSDQRFVARCEQVGLSVMVAEAERQAIIRGKGGDSVYAEGVLTALNKGMRRKFMVGATS